MPSNKIYSVERRIAVVPPVIRDALGLPGHVQQVDLYVIAPTGRAARELLATTGMFGDPVPPVKVAAGWDATALLAAADGPAVLVYAGLGHNAPDRRVLRVDAERATSLVGHLDGHMSATRLAPAAGV